MKVLISWLKEYVEVPFSIGDLGERLPMLGIGVDSIQQIGDDAVCDLEIAANRGDLMSHLGIAREISAITRTAVRMPSGAVDPRGPRTAELANVEVREPELCPRFTAALIVDVHVAPSPEWMARRLEACGIRSINNIVDITNYVMLEMGQPMHAFDYDLVHGGRLVVRLATSGERLTTLDGMQRTLDPQILVVADADRAVGVAGIIGGANSEIRSSTRRVLLEAASWHPPLIRRTAKRLSVRTESGARFERGVDTEAVLSASRRAQQLMQELAGGRVLSDPLDLYPSPPPKRQIELGWADVTRLLGMPVPQADGVAILRSLGFGVAERADVVAVTVPSFRRDVQRAEDLIEDVARHYGYEQIPEHLPVAETSVAVRAPVVEAERMVRDLLIRAGLTEALTVSLTTPAVLDGLQLPSDHSWRAMVRLRNPLIEDHTHLRTTLLPGLLQVARVNVSRHVPDVQIFEIGHTFHPSGKAVAEHRRLAILMTGRLLHRAWNVPAPAVNASYFYLKGAVESLLSELRIDGAVFAAGPSPWLHPGRAATVSLPGVVVGTLGEIDPAVAARHDLPPEVYVADLDLEALVSRAVFRPQYTPLPRFPSVRRDVAAVVPNEHAAAEVERILREAGGPLLASMELFDVYTGPPVPAGHRNLAYALSFRSGERTLSADEVDVALERIKQGLRRQLRAKIRE